MPDSSFPEWGVVSSGGAPTTVTSSGTSTTVAIPTTADGGKAKWVRVCVTGFAHVLPVQGSGTTITATTGILVSPNNDIMLNVRGYTHIAYLQESAGAKVNITPIEV